MNFVNKLHDYDYDKEEDDNGDGQTDNEEDLLILWIVSYNKRASWDRYLKQKSNIALMFYLLSKWKTEVRQCQTGIIITFFVDTT